MTESESQPSPEEVQRAELVVEKFRDEVQRRLFEIENKFDSATLLVAGGAFTISAAIVSTLKIQFESPTALLWAWGAWALCLMLCIGGHLLSAQAHQHILTHMSKGQYDLNVLLGSRAARLIPWVNRATYVFLLVGFIAFGKFTYDNLAFGREHGSERQASSEEDAQEKVSEEVQGISGPSIQRTETGVGLAKTETTAPEVSHDRETEDAARTTEAGGLHEESTATSQRPGAGGEGDERAPPGP